MRVTISVIAILLSSMQTANAQERTNRARLAWSAFTCATFAELKGDKDEQERLFKIGYDAAEGYLQGIADKTITEKETANAPMIVNMLLGGPNFDFMVGRIFESATRDAYDDVTKEDGAGMPLTDEGYLAARRDKNVQGIVAAGRYEKGNCELIGQK